MEEEWRKEKTPHMIKKSILSNVGTRQEQNIRFNKKDKTTTELNLGAFLHPKSINFHRKKNIR